MLRVWNWPDGAAFGPWPAHNPANDPLPSWNDGPAKKAILELVRVTTNKASRNVPPGASHSLKTERRGRHPMYPEWCSRSIASWRAKHPELKEKQPFKAVIDGDRALNGQIHREGC